jgi:hypothetical protein
MQDSNGEDFTGINQHTCKKTRSTFILLIDLQFIIARALDEDQVGVVASLDLSLAFGVVNIKLLLKDSSSLAYQMM